MTELCRHTLLLGIDTHAVALDGLEDLHSLPYSCSKGCGCLQALPNVMDIEANPETGEWRIAGSQGAWMHIRDDPAKVLDSSVVIKPEPQLGTAAPVAGPQGGAFPLHALLVNFTHLQELLTIRAF